MTRTRLKLMAVMLIAFCVQAIYVRPTLAYTRVQPKSCCGHNCPQRDMPMTPSSCCFVAPGVADPANVSTPRLPQPPSDWVALPIEDRRGVVISAFLPTSVPLMVDPHGAPIFLLERSLLL